MTLHINRWTPDTCDCVLRYTWTDEAGPDVQTPLAVERACPTHTGLGLVDVHAAVKRENDSKNDMMGHAVAQVAKLRHFDEDGNAVLPPGVQMRWSFTGSGKNRALTVEFVGVTLTPGEQGLLRAAAAQLPAPTTVT